MCPSKTPARNPTPVTNPDKGAKYLKKSPSPTGAKSPPGGANSAEAFLHGKAAVAASAACQQVRKICRARFRYRDSY